MAYITLPSKGRGYQLHLDLAQVSQNVALNQTTVSWVLYITKGTGSGAFTSYSCSWSSSGSSGSIGGFNFSGYSSLTLGSGTFTVTHAADGTGTANTSGSFSESDPDPELGNGTVYASLALTTIPRATQPTVSPTSGNTAATYTIGHTPAASTFYHDVAYSLDNGATYTNIQTNIVGTDVSTDWTPAHSLIPNAGSLTAILRVITRETSGGTIIGTKTVSLPLTVPSSVKPTISSVTWDDAQVSAPDMPTLMGGSGRFVQGWSKLKPTVTSAGAGGSTVTSVAVTQNGQVTPSGTAFGLPVAVSGSVPYSAIATDSRVRTSDVYANTVDVTAYNFPNLPTPTVTRTSDAGGTTPSPTGTYLAITPAASVSTLIFGAAEKNLLEWRVRIKQAGGAYSTVQDWTASTVSGNTWTTKYVAAGPYLSSNEYVVEVSIRDLFGKNGYSTSSTVVTKEVTVPSELVFMDWDGNSGIGLGGYRRYGLLDVHGDIYADNVYQGGYRVADLSLLATTTVKGLVELSTDAETATGTATNLATTPASVASAYYTKTLLDGGQLDTRYYTETEINGLVTNNAFIGSRRMIPPTVAKSGGGTVVIDADGTVRVSVSGPTAISLNDIFQLGKNYEIDIIALNSAASNNAFRFRTGGTDYSGASGYVWGGFYDTITWIGNQAGSGYGLVNNGPLLSVNGKTTMWTKLFILNKDNTSTYGFHYLSNSRDGSQQTVFNGSGDCGSAQNTGFTLISGGGTFSAGTQIKVWELK